MVLSTGSAGATPPRRAVAKAIFPARGWASAQPADMLIVAPSEKGDSSGAV
jgi:hypothetical protein